MKSRRLLERAGRGGGRDEMRVKAAPVFVYPTLTCCLHTVLFVMFEFASKQETFPPGAYIPPAPSGQKLIGRAIFRRRRS